MRRDHSAAAALANRDNEMYELHAGLIAIVRSPGGSPVNPGAPGLSSCGTRTHAPMAWDVRNGLGGIFSYVFSIATLGAFIAVT